jgi:hypothetical protein
MADIKGKAIIWACGGLSFTAGIVPSGTEVPAIQRARAQQEIEGKAIIKSSAGLVASVVVPDIHKTQSYTVIPTADTLAAVRTLMDKFYITPGTKITVADTDGNWEGNYMLVSCSQERSVDAAVAVDIELENWTTDISTSAA